MLRSTHLCPLSKCIIGVRVYEQVSKNEWMVDSDEPAKVALPYGRWKCCPDFDCGPYIRTGYMAYEVKYQPIRGCNSIRGSGLGWFWQPPGSKSWMNLKGEMTQ
jgi:hypothetical protein